MWKTFFVVVVVGVVGSIFTLSDRNFSNKKKLNEAFHPAENRSSPTDKAFAKAVEFFKIGEMEEVLNIIQHHEDSLNYETLQGKEWVDLFLATVTATGDHAVLEDLYADFPAAFQKDEETSLLLANYFLSQKNLVGYNHIQKEWRKNGAEEQAWFFLDVDAYLIDQRQEEAIELLQSRSFAGAADCSRLIRLSLLTLKDDPNLSWKYLKEAELKDPSNPDIHLYRASLLESIDHKAEAEAQYAESVKKDPNNIFLKDELAEFYLRLGQTSSSLMLWREILAEIPIDSIWIKALFWDRIVGRGDFDWSTLDLPSGEKKTVIAYLRDLPQGRFWDQEAFERIANGKKLVANEDSFFWLKFLDLLESGESQEALDLLTASGKEVIPQQFPTWIAVDVVRALDAEKGYGEALKFAVLQEPSEELSCLIDQLLKAAKNDEAVMAKLKPMAKELTEKGAKLSWLISRLYIDRGNFTAARQTILTQPLLVDLLAGKELLARIAMLEGDRPLASRLYLEIENRSFEAKSYLAREAFQEKNWGRARQITEELLQSYPDNPILLDNLRKITQELSLNQS